MILVKDPVVARNLVVAIDGPAGSGKSTVARLVARALGCVFLDTGAIYRALALVSTRAGVSWDDAPALAALARGLRITFQGTDGGQRVLVAAEDVSDAIRVPDISRGASDVSRHAAVREALLETQRRFAQQGSVVAEGRDVGTVVFPKAAVKVYLVADPGVRASRRLGDLRRAGHDTCYEQVLAQQGDRDQADSSRAVAPLAQAEDAIVVDTTDQTVEQVVARIVELCGEVGAAQREAERA